MKLEPSTILLGIIVFLLIALLIILVLQNKNGIAFKHMEVLLNDSNKEIATLRKENASLREQVADMQHEVAELKANLILLLNAVERLNVSEITQRAIEAMRASVKDVLDASKKKQGPKAIRKDEGA